MGFSGGAETRYKKYPCKRKSYETICENIVSRYQTLVSSLLREAVFRSRRSKTQFMTGPHRKPSNNNSFFPEKVKEIEVISRYLELIQLSLRQWPNRTENLPTLRAQSCQKKATLIHSWASRILYFALRRSNNSFFNKLNEEHSTFHLLYKYPGTFANRKYEQLSTP